MIPIIKNRRLNYTRYGYYFALPFLLGVAIFILYPMFYTVYISFTDLSGFTSNQPNFIAFENYRRVLKNPFWKQTLQNTIIMWGVSAMIQYPLQLFIAFCFSNRHMAIKGQQVFKFLIYMPNMIGQMAVGVIFCTLFAYPGGAINQLLANLGIASSDINFLGTTSYFRGLVSYIDFWYYWGGGLLITVAAIAGIDPSLNEAAEIDGANSFQVFTKITLPSIKKVLVYIYITGAIGGLQMYGIPYMLSAQGAGRGTTDNALLKTGRTVIVWVRELAFSNDFKYGRAAAVSLLLFLVLSVISGILLFIMRDRSEVRLQKHVWRKDS